MLYEVITMIYAVASLAFLLVGYSIAFGDFGSDTMSKWAAFLFQMAFVGKVINIMSGGVSERAKVLPLALFTIIMGGIIYPIIVNCVITSYSIHYTKLYDPP